MNNKPYKGGINLSSNIAGVGSNSSDEGGAEFESSGPDFYVTGRRPAEVESFTCRESRGNEAVLPLLTSTVGL